MTWNASTGMCDLDATQSGFETVFGTYLTRSILSLFTPNGTCGDWTTTKGGSLRQRPVRNHVRDAQGRRARQGAIQSHRQRHGTHAPDGREFSSSTTTPTAAPISSGRPTCTTRDLHRTRSRSRQAGSSRSPMRAAPPCGRRRHLRVFMSHHTRCRSSTAATSRSLTARARPCGRPTLEPVRAR